MSEATALTSLLDSGGGIFTAIESLQSTKYLAVACFGLLVYEYFITLEQEIKLFWRPNITITRVLFFMNRYLPLINSIVVMSWFFRPLPSHDVRHIQLVSECISDNVKSCYCYGTMVSTATFTIFEVIIMQAILVARVIHLWTWNQAVQRFVLLFFLVCIMAVTTIFGYVMKDTGSIVLPLPLKGCFDVSLGPNSHLYWAMLVPTFVLETVLVVLTVFRIVRPLQRSDYKNKLLSCLLRDGCVFYGCVCACVGFGVVGSALWDKPKVAYPAIFSGFLPIVLSICASRLLFNLHELAEDLVGQPTFALNNVELSRLNLKKGPHKGEFIVEARREPQSPMKERDGRFNSIQKSCIIIHTEGDVGGYCIPETPREIEPVRLPFIKRISKFRINVESSSTSFV
ncbi:hypothetical protein PNOK_0892900 [Pyrrhoderma noxium]|uniref:DUF6533 domain-containing protein n=1 Tax=Pyrrhoderma noxium TaxID=2282107 RepID=A0A286U6G9_9AGAM|nr:hypothetical protein PNOK_0892900 [Pyrrhoderma noxium]